MTIYFRWPNRHSLAQYAVVSILAANVLAIIWIWQTGSAYYLDNPGDGNIWFAFGRLTGLLGQFALLLQLLFIGRAPFIERPFGFDKLNAVHRWIGYTIASLMIAHPFLLTYGTARSNGSSLIGQFVDYLTNREHVFNSYLGSVLLIVVILSSIVIVRKKVPYETWYFVHLLTYVAVGLIFLHQLHTGDVRSGGPWIYWLTLNCVVGGSFVIYRWIRPLWLIWFHQFRVDHVQTEVLGVTSVYIIGKHLDRFGFKPGQYANLRFLSRTHGWQSHPFSFSAGPNGHFLRFSMKASGDYTKTLEQLRPGTPVLIDGPLGQFILSRANRKKILMIAGGIGITPLRALLDDEHITDRDTVLLYANRTVQDIALRAELDTYTQHGAFRIVYFLNAPLPGYESGYIDREKIVRLVPDFYDREVFLCGPPMMMKAVVTQLRGLGYEDRHIHYERFSF